MGASDVYRAEWRTEQAGVVMSNSLSYRQLTATPPGFVSGAEALAAAVRSDQAGVAHWAINLMGEDAQISCIITEKVLDVSLSGKERAVAFDNTIVGIGSDTLPPQSAAAFQISSVGSGDPDDWDFHMLYLGGLDESLVNGPYFTTEFSTRHYTRLQSLNFPRVAGGDSLLFQLAVNETSPEGGAAPDDFRPAHIVSQPLWPSIRKSRRAFLCG